MKVLKAYEGLLNTYVPMKQLLFLSATIFFIHSLATAQTKQFDVVKKNNASRYYKDLVVNPEDFAEVDAWAEQYIPRNTVYTYNEAVKTRAFLEEKVKQEPNSIGLRWALLRFYVSASNFLGGSNVKAMEQARQIYGESNYIGCLAFEYIYARMNKMDKAELWYKKSLYLARLQKEAEWKEYTYKKQVNESVKVSGAFNNWQKSNLYENNDGSYSRKVLVSKHAPSNAVKFVVDERRMVVKNDNQKL